jgi:hypothetical protein
MHDQNHHPGHIPPPDPPLEKRTLGLKTHHLIGGLFLIAILLIYILLLARHDAWFATHPHPTNTSSLIPPQNSPPKI